MNTCRYPAALLLSLIATATWAQGSSAPIAYSARYYSQKGASHFHLYRINPDGTGRRQVTFGDTDDNLPAWSPDGKHIAFWRKNTLWLIDANDKNTRPFYKTATDDFYPRRWTLDNVSSG